MQRPYKGLAIVPIIWEVGNGHFQSLALIDSWKLRSVVSSCWTISPEDRATFEDIVENIERNVSQHVMERRVLRGTILVISYLKNQS